MSGEVWAATAEDDRDPIEWRAYFETHLACEICLTDYAVPGEADCVSELAVDAWAVRMATEARDDGWDALPDWRILCPSCLAHWRATDGQPPAESVEQRIARLLAEEIAVVDADPGWRESFLREAEHLRACFHPDLTSRIEHFGSTAVPGLAAKPIVDMLVEVSSLRRVKAEVVPPLEFQGYDYLWRPTFGDDGPPFYAWFIKRDPESGARTHHIHMVEADFEVHWERLLFRDYLIAHPDVAAEYAALKRELAASAKHDRVAYTRGKSEFIRHYTERAKCWSRTVNPPPEG